MRPQIRPRDDHWGEFASPFIRMAEPPESANPPWQMWMDGGGPLLRSLGQITADVAWQMWMDGGGPVWPLSETPLRLTRGTTLINT